MALKVGFIGAGGMAQAHMKGVATVPEATIVGICDLDAGRAQAAAQQFGAAESCTSYRDLLKMDLDAVYVVVPPFAHGEVEAAVIDRGLPFLVEKPVALSMDMARKIRDSAAKKNLITCVGYQLRYMASIGQAKAFMDGRTLGMIVGFYWSAMVGIEWWQDVDRAGGQIVEQATHIVDLMRDFGGEIVEVDAHMKQRGQWSDPKITVPDVSTVQFSFANGALGALTTCCLLGEWNIGIDIMMKEARLHWKIDEVDVTPAKLVLPPREQFPAAGIDKVFLDAVRTGDRSKIRSPYEDAVRTLGVTLAANESAKSGKPVKVKE